MCSPSLISNSSPALDSIEAMRSHDQLILLFTLYYNTMHAVSTTALHHSKLHGYDDLLVNIKINTVPLQTHNVMYINTLHVSIITQIIVMQCYYCG